MLTGRPHEPANSENSKVGAPNDWPCLGAVVRHLRRSQEQSSGLPGSVTLPENLWNTGHFVWPGQDAGWLGRAADPWLLTCDPSRADFRVPEPRSTRPFRPAFPGADHCSPRSTPSRRHRPKQCREPLHHPKSTGLRYAAARRKHVERLIFESSCLRCATATAGIDLAKASCWPGGSSRPASRWCKSIGRAADDSDINPVWDTHARNSDRLKKTLMPPMDQAYSALLRISPRGLLDDTLVVWMGEFGRSPKINGAGGRDHWGHVYSAALRAAAFGGRVMAPGSQRRTSQGWPRAAVRSGSNYLPLPRPGTGNGDSPSSASWCRSPKARSFTSYSRTAGSGVPFLPRSKREYRISDAEFEFRMSRL